MSLYYQCDLRRGRTLLTNWVEERGAKAGVLVELPTLAEPERLWYVEAVYGQGIPEDLLKRHQRMHRGSLPSVERMGA